MSTSKISESIFQKRVKRFKAMKRGYYSLIILVVFYIISLLGPLWMNDKALIIKYNNTYYFPAIMDFLDFIPGVDYPLYESKTFNPKEIFKELISLVVIFIVIYLAHLSYHFLEKKIYS